MFGIERGSGAAAAGDPREYEVSTTIIKNCGGFEVELKIGVKQGDPLSSMLFNMVHDPLLERLKDQGGGLQVGDHSISVFAAADDLYQLACDPVEAQFQLDMVVNHLNDIGMELSMFKSWAFHVKQV